MFPRVLTVLCCAAFLFGTCTLPASAQEPEEPLTTDPEIYVNDICLPDAADTYDGVVYVNMTAVAAALRPESGSEWDVDRMRVYDEGLEFTAAPDDLYAVVNGRYLYVPNGVKMDDSGMILLPASTMALAMDAVLTPSEDGGSLSFTNAEISFLEPAETFYDPAAVDLLARVIYNESGNQCMEGRIAVGNVLLNRVESSLFPSTLAEVIAQPGQFPNSTGKAPDAESIIAAKLCLEGASIVPNAYWFNVVGLSSWASQNKTLIATIEDHSFFG